MCECVTSGEASANDFHSTAQRQYNKKGKHYCSLETQKHLSKLLIDFTTVHELHKYMDT